MFDGIKNAGGLFGAVLRAAVRHPVFILPLILVWAVYAPLVVYLYFYFDWDRASFIEGLAVIFGFIFGI